MASAKNILNSQGQKKRLQRAQNTELFRWLSGPFWTSVFFTPHSNGILFAAEFPGTAQEELKRPPGQQHSFVEKPVVLRPCTHRIRLSRVNCNISEISGAFGVASSQV